MRQPMTPAVMWGVAGASYQHTWLVKEGAEDVHVSKETARAWFRMLN